MSEQCQSLQGFAIVQLTRHMLHIVAMICSPPATLSLANLSHVLLADEMHHAMHLNMLVAIYQRPASSCMRVWWMAAIKVEAVVFIVT